MGLYRPLSLHTIIYEFRGTIKRERSGLTGKAKPVRGKTFPASYDTNVERNSVFVLVDRMKIVNVDK